MIHLNQSSINRVTFTLAEKRTNPLTSTLFVFTDAAGRDTHFVAQRVAANQRHDTFYITLADDADPENGIVRLEPGMYIYRLYEVELSIPPTLGLAGGEPLIEKGRAVVHGHGPTEFYAPAVTPVVFYRG